MAGSEMAGSETDPLAGLDHERFMALALAEARRGFRAEEVPVGAVLAELGGAVLASAHNRTVTLNDPTAHAEVLALRRAARRRRNYRLLNTVLYVTVEPCMMCMGAILQARLTGLVFGAPDPRWGAAGSLFDLSADPRLNHRVTVLCGVRREACGRLMRSFFRVRRKRGNDD